MIQASLKDLVTTGQLGPIRLGTTRTLVAEALGEPDDYSVNSRDRQRKRLPPAIWKYGDIELHFDDETDRVHLLFLERFTIPSGGTKLQLDPWIIQHTLTIDTLQHGLEQNHIPVRRERKPHDDLYTLHLIAGVGVDFLFTTEEEWAGPPVGLTIISYSASVSNL